MCLENHEKPPRGPGRSKPLPAPYSEVFSNKPRLEYNVSNSLDYDGWRSCTIRVLSCVMFHVSCSVALMLHATVLLLMVDGCGRVLISYTRAGARASMMPNTINSIKSQIKRHHESLTQNCYSRILVRYTIIILLAVCCIISSTFFKTAKRAGTAVRRSTHVQGRVGDTTTQPYIHVEMPRAPERPTSTDDSTHALRYPYTHGHWHIILLLVVVSSLKCRH